jgi:Xaa-Pro dipeptidase
MKAAGYSALIVFSSVLLDYKGSCRYIANYRISSGKEYIVLPISGNPVLILATIGQKSRAIESSWIADVRAGGGTETVIREAASTVASTGPLKGKVGVVNLLTSMPLYDYQCLTETPPGVELEDATALFDRIRSVKSLEEIKMIRLTTEIADHCYSIVLSALGPGANELDIISEITAFSPCKRQKTRSSSQAKDLLFPASSVLPDLMSLAKGTIMSSRSRSADRADIGLK